MPDRPPLDSFLIGDQEQQPSAPKQRPPLESFATDAAPSYSLGPISDAATLLNRGIDRMFGLTPSAPYPELGRPVNLPIVGQPSAAGMARNVYQTAKSGATLPGDVYAGRVDPLSDEGIRRAADLAQIATAVAPSSIPSVVRRTGTPALSTVEIERQAGAGYDALRDASRANALPAGMLDTITDTVRQQTMKGPSPKTAPRTYQEIEGLRTPATTGDVGDLIDTRRNLMAIVREGGAEGNAAGRAVAAIDDHLGPELTATVKNLDKNWAIAQRAGEVETQMANARRMAEASRYVPREGTQLRRVATPFLKEGTEQFRFATPQVQEAARAAATAGPIGRTMQGLSVMDPSRGYLSLGANLFAAPYNLAHPGTMALQGIGMGVGYGAGKIYDAMMRNRAAQLSNAIRQEAPASMAQPGFVPSGYGAGGVAPFAPSQSLPLLPRPRQQQPQTLMDLTL